MRGKNTRRSRVRWESSQLVRTSYKISGINPNTGLVMSSEPEKLIETVTSSYASARGIITKLSKLFSFTTFKIKRGKPDENIAALQSHWKLSEEQKQILVTLSSTKLGANFIDEKILFIDKNEAAISPSIALKVINYFRNKKQNVLEINELNDRELQVLEFIAKGCLNKEIADKLFLSIDSIKKIAQNIYQKLYVRNRSEAIKKYLDSL